MNSLQWPVFIGQWSVVSGRSIADNWRRATGHWPLATGYWRPCTTARQVFLPFPDRQLLELPDHRVDFDHRRIEMGFKGLLLGFHRPAILLQQWPNQKMPGQHEERLHQPAWQAQARERDPEGIEVKNKKRPAGALVDGQQEAPVLDPAAGVRPLVGIIDPQLHGIGVHAAAIDKQPGDSAPADQGFIGEAEAIPLAIAAKQPR